MIAIIMLMIIVTMIIVTLMILIIITILAPIVITLSYNNADNNNNNAQSLWRITCPPPEQKHQELVGKTLWVNKNKKIMIILVILISATVERQHAFGHKGAAEDI